MAERRRWADVWWASSRGEAVSRVILLQGEYVVAAIPGDRKWCVLVSRPPTAAELRAAGVFFTTPDLMTVLGAVTTS